MAWQDYANLPVVGSAYRYQSPTARPTKAPKKGGRGGTLTSLISEGGALGGAAAGAAVGSVVPVVGTAIGGILGAGLGAFGGRLAENKIRDDRWGVGDAAKEGALSAALAGPVRALKYGVTAAKTAKGGTGLSEALKAGAEKASGPGLIGRGLGAVKTRTSQRAANKFVEITPTAMQRLQEEGRDPQILLSRWGKQLGKNYDEMIKNSDRFIKEAEDTISKTAGVTGRNIRIDGSDIIKQLKTEAKKIGTELGGGQRVKQIQAIIADAQKKYAKGITVQQARNILREANQRFGASVLDDAGDAVARAAQKLEANTLRSALKSRFPTIEKSLNDQSELIQLRELLKKGKAVNASKKGTNVGKLDITRPGSFIDALTGLPQVTSRLATRGAPGTPGMVRNAIRGAGMGARGAIAGGLAEALTSPAQSDMSSMSSNTTPMTNTTTNTMTNAFNIPELSQPNVNMSTDPLAPENLQSSIQQILANGGTLADAKGFVDLATALQKLQPATSQKPLTASQATRAAAANNALRDIPMIADAIESGKLGGAKVLPGSGTQIGRRLLGTENLDAALFNIADNILRARTGAAAPEAEVKRFVDTFLPAATDSKQAKVDKLQRAIRELQGYVNPMEASADTLEDTLLQGAF